MIIDNLNLDRLVVNLVAVWRLDFLNGVRVVVG